MVALARWLWPVRASDALPHERDMLASFAGSFKEIVFDLPFFLL